MILLRWLNTRKPAYMYSHQKKGYMYYVLVCVLIASASSLLLRPKTETESLDYDFGDLMCHKTILKLEYMYVRRCNTCLKRRTGI